MTSSILESDVSSGGVFGRLFTPSTCRTHAVAIVLGGSGGGTAWSGEAARQLAAEGHAALALAYFHWPGLPKYLELIPLEYIGSAIHWVSTQAPTAGRPLVLVGASRGAELALLAASHYPQVNAVVAVSPSSVLWGAVGGLGAVGRPAWTFGGQVLPYMTVPTFWRQPRAAASAALSLLLGWPLRGTPAFLEALQDVNAVVRAAIPVENIKGSVLLISGKDDQMWPSSKMAEDIRLRLQKAQHPFEVRHVSYEGAGHAVSTAKADSYPTLARHRLTHMTYDLGGNECANRTASESARTEMLTFLRHNVR